MELAPRKRDNPDEENMHEISFGTKNSETEIENIFQKLPTNNSDLGKKAPSYIKFRWISGYLR
jgi:hypothetical protein